MITTSTVPTNFSTYHIDGTNSLLIDKYAPGVLVLEVAAPSQGAVTPDFLLDAFSRMSDEEREAFAALLHDRTLAADMMQAILGDLRRKYILPTEFLDTHLLADIIAKIFAKRGGMVGAAFQAYHGLWYVIAQRLGLTTAKDDTALVVQPRRQLLPTFEHLRIDLIRYALRKTLLMPDIKPEKQISGHLLLKRVQIYFTHVALALRHSIRLVYDFRVVIGTLQEYLTGRLASHYRETQAPFPALSRVLTLVTLALTPAPANTWIHLTEVENFRWYQSVQAVYEWLGAAESDFALIGADEFGTFFKMQRVVDEEAHRFHLVHVSRALDTKIPLYSLGVHLIEQSPGTPTLVVHNDRVSLQLRAWQDAFLSTFAVDSWERLAAAVANRGQFNRTVFVSTASEEELAALALCNSDGFRATWLPDRASAQVTYQFGRSEEVARRHLARRGRITHGDVITTEDLHDVLLYGKVERIGVGTAYPSRTQSADKWLKQTSLVHLENLKRVDLAREDVIKFHQIQGNGRETENRAVKASLETLFDLQHHARATTLIENPVANSYFEAPLTLATAVSFLTYDHEFAHRQMGMAIVNLFAPLLENADIIRATHVLLEKGGVSLRTGRDSDDIRTWGNAEFAVVLFLLRHVGQVTGPILLGMVRATEFTKQISDTILARLLYAGV